MKEPGVVAQTFIPSTPVTEAHVPGQARLEGHLSQKKEKENVNEFRLKNSEVPLLDYTQSPASVSTPIPRLSSDGGNRLGTYLKNPRTPSSLSQNTLVRQPDLKSFTKCFTKPMLLPESQQLQSIGATILCS